MVTGYYYPNYATQSVSWTPQYDPVFPLTQTVDHPNLRSITAGGTLYVQNKVPKQESFELVFELMPKTDRDNYLTFFNAVERDFKTFEYRDPDGNLSTVRIMNAFNFKLDRPQLYSGTILLRKE